MNVLVVAATRHGATGEIAATIAEVIGCAGHDVVVRRAEEVTSVDDADAVVLGSAVYAGRWLRPARDLLEAQSDSLAARPTWLFSSGPIGDPPRPGPAEAVRLEPDATQIEPREHRVFAGKLVRQRLGFAERAMVTAFRAADGDFRDWGEITAWAQAIADVLTAAESAAGAAEGAPVGDHAIGVPRGR